MAQCDLCDDRENEVEYLIEEIKSLRKEIERLRAELDNLHAANETPKGEQQ